MRKALETGRALMLLAGLTLVTACPSNSAVDGADSADMAGVDNADVGATPNDGVQSVTLVPVKDNTLYEDDQGAVSNGAGMRLFVGQTAQSLARRSVIAFDVAASVPKGATITAVRFLATVARASSGSGPRVVELHRLLDDWGEGTSVASGNGGGGAPATEGDATWIHRFSATDRWLQPGGDFSEVVSASTSVDDVGVYAWESTPALVSDIQQWLDASDTNFGWCLLGDESEMRTSKSFHSRESEDALARPMLEIVYTTP